MGTHLFRRHEVAEEKEVGKAVERGRRRALARFVGLLGTLAFVLFLIPITSPPAAHAAFPGTRGKMYWADAGTDKIQRANLDGTSVEDLVTGLQAPYGIALDLAGGKVYWTNTGAGTIQRANLDGTGVVTLLTGEPNITGIALDLAGGKMYYLAGNTPDRIIQRANLDGTGVVTLVGSPGGLSFIALDLAGGKMYWTDPSNDKIQRANLDGTGVEDLVTGLQAPYGIALDLAGGKMYWTEIVLDKIQRANLNGSGVEDVVMGLTDPYGIALDLAGGKMYWTALTVGKIQRANLDGTGAVEDLVTGLSNPAGIAQVGYNFSGFFPPVDNPGPGPSFVFNVAKAGSAIPVKFSLSGDQGLNIFAAGYPVSQKIECDASSTLDVVEETTTAGSSSLSYDPTTDQYNYVWKTLKAWANTCRQLVVRLNDGTDHVAYFNFTK